MNYIEKIADAKSKKILKTLMKQFDDSDIDLPEFKEALRTMSLHEAEEAFIYSNNLTSKKKEFEELRLHLEINWINKRELKKMKHQEIFSYYIESLVGNLLYDKYDILYTL